MLPGTFSSQPASQLTQLPHAHVTENCFGCGGDVVDDKADLAVGVSGVDDGFDEDAVDVEGELRAVGDDCQQVCLVQPFVDGRAGAGGREIAAVVLEDGQGETAVLVDAEVVECGVVGVGNAEGQTPGVALHDFHLHLAGEIAEIGTLRRAKEGVIGDRGSGNICAVDKMTTAVFALNVVPVVALIIIAQGIVKGQFPGWRSVGIGVVGDECGGGTSLLRGSIRLNRGCSSLCGTRTVGSRGCA